MSSSTHGLVLKKTLMADELTAIEQLVAICNNYEGLHTRLGLDMLRERSGNEIDDFCYCEDGILAGYLCIDSYGTKEKEVVLLVHPDHRRRHIGSRLLEAAKKESRQRRVQKLFLVCEHLSQSGQAFVEAIGAQLDHAEHEMVLGTFQERAVFDDRLIFRKATQSDIEAIVTILSSEFKREDLDFTRQHVADLIQRPDQHLYISTFGTEGLGCAEPVGTLRFDERLHEIGIYGFVILPEYRGRGYGRQMLEEAINAIRSRGQKGIMLDVEITNTSAIGLYLSCGFETKTTYDYYEVAL